MAALKPAFRVSVENSGRTRPGPPCRRACAAHGTVSHSFSTYGTHTSFQVCQDLVRAWWCLQQAGCQSAHLHAVLPAVLLLLQAKQISIIYHLIRRGKTSPLPSVYSRELQALVARMMARDPCDRPSCAELLQEDILK